MASQRSASWTIILRANHFALALAMLLGAVQPARAQTYTVLHAFTGTPDGSLPVNGVLRDAQGNLYGTTYLGGNQSCGSYPGCGTVFTINMAGQESILYNFTEKNGLGPAGYLNFMAGSTLYGTTVSGGTFGDGSAFRISETGNLTVLYSFNTGSGGYHPYLIDRDSSGNLHGSTTIGGNQTSSGVLFKLGPSRKETVLYSFTCPECNRQSGGGFGFPGAPIRDSSGNFYGPAAGGTHNSGVIFKVTKAGVGRVLYNFKGMKDGWDPLGPLVRDAAGNLYGTTDNPAGSHCGSLGCGTVFKVSPQGHDTVLYTFTGGTDGGHPGGGLVRDAQGNLYGTTWDGGTSSNSCGDPYDQGCGVIFKIDPSGHETVLYTFLNLTDGGYPSGNLIMDPAGNLYGTTSSGGDPTCQCGVVFKFTP